MGAEVLAALVWLTVFHVVWGVGQIWVKRAPW